MNVQILSLATLLGLSLATTSQATKVRVWDPADPAKQEKNLEMPYTYKKALILRHPEAPAIKSNAYGMPFESHKGWEAQNSIFYAPMQK